MLIKKLPMMLVTFLSLYLEGKSAGLLVNESNENVDTVIIDRSEALSISSRLVLHWVHHYCIGTATKVTYTVNDRKALAMLAIEQNRIQYYRTRPLGRVWGAWC